MIVEVVAYVLTVAHMSTGCASKRRRLAMSAAVEAPFIDIIKRRGGLENSIVSPFNALHEQRGQTPNVPTESPAGRWLYAACA